MIQLASRVLAKYSHVNWALADQAMVSGVNFLTGVLLARYLGLEEFGRFTLAWMAVLFTHNLQQAMIISPMMSFGPKQPEAETPAYYAAIITQQLIFMGLIVLVMLVAVHFVSVAFPGWSADNLFLPLVAVTLTFQLQNFLRRYFFTRNRGAAAFIVDAVHYLGQLGLLLWLLPTFRGQMNTSRVLWVITAAATAAILYGSLNIGRIQWVPEIFRTTVSRHWQFAKWLVGSAIMQWTSGNLFILAAGALLGVATVGALKAAQTLMGVTHILFMGLENIVPIRAAWHLRHGGKPALVIYLRRVTLLGEFATASVATIAAIAPDFWLHLIFGSEYSGYGYVLRWFAVIYLFLFIGLPLTAGLRAIEDTRTIFWARCWTALFSIVAAYPLIELLGLSGAVAGLLLTNLILVTVLATGLKRRLAGNNYFY